MDESKKIPIWKQKGWKKPGAKKTQRKRRYSPSGYPWKRGKRFRKHIQPTQGHRMAKVHFITVFGQVQNKSLPRKQRRPGKLTVRVDRPPKPRMNFCGRYLEDAGFTIGSTVAVTFPQRGMLVACLVDTEEH